MDFVAPQPLEPFASAAVPFKMLDLPAHLFLNPVLTALQTAHAHFAITHGAALRYPAAIAPFAAVAAPNAMALRDLHTLLTPDEYVWMADVGEADPAAANLAIQTTIDVLQMVLPPKVELPPLNPTIAALTCSHAAEMVGLTDIAFPGFFRPRTCEMGDYFGINSTEDELIAMGGERLIFPGYSEISGLCTHPSHRGQGHAARLLWHIARLQRSRGIIPWLHVTATNRNAVDLYLKLGFEIIRSIKLYKVAHA